MCLDIDDTLLDNAASSRSGLAALVGHDAAWPVWRRTTDEHYARYLAGDVDFDTMLHERTRAFFAEFGELLTDAEVARREHHRMCAMQRAWRLFHDVAPCLEWLHASGYRLAAVTNAPGGYQRKKMASVGLSGVFDAVIISGEVGVAKPDPAIFEIACAELGVPSHQVLHVGDRLDVDATAAVRAGLRGVWLDRSGVPAPRQTDVPVIAGLDELPEHLVCDYGVEHADPPRSAALASAR
ncbi:HAD-IA family hydrolase [Allosaccharopolyspora coralli]|uniref:HAD-IA family hydrolase n=1 Tax=Allosaccharopolyspora coralli TaxID=2665642 RepID=A0A5Q3QNN4_9PSEU|nr:HAD-IA family hydrolase [Allosaccharopolyspora coralli]